MMKIVLPALLALCGLGAGVGAGMALKPKAPVADACSAAEAGHAEAGHAGTDQGAAVPAGAEGSGAEAAATEEAAADKAASADCAQPAAAHAPSHGPELESVSLDKPFVVPVFDRETIVGMVVVSLSVEVAHGKGGEVSTLQPRLRDGFLAAMFRHANSGGFDGSFTAGQKMSDLKSALRAVAQEVMPEAGVGDVLVTEIVRQDV